MQNLGGLESPDKVDIRLYADDELINSVGLAQGLADSITANGWDGECIIGTDSREAAETVHDSLTS